MRFPTIPEMEDRAECFLFGHDWTTTRRADDMEDNALRAQTNLRAAEERVDEWRQAALEESAAQPRPLMHETPPAITLSRIRQLTYNAKRRNETIRPDQILAILERRKA